MKTRELVKKMLEIEEAIVPEDKIEQIVHNGNLVMLKFLLDHSEE